VEKEDPFDAVPSCRAHQRDGLLRLDSEIELAAGSLQYRADTIIAGGNVASLGGDAECIDEGPDIAQRRRIGDAEHAARERDAKAELIQVLLGHRHDPRADSTET
jgi:hypothetical protein